MTNLKKSKSVVNIGVDVGKFCLDICIYETDTYWQEDNTVEGAKRIVKRLSHLSLTKQH